MRIKTAILLLFLLNLFAQESTNPIATIITAENKLEKKHNMVSAEFTIKDTPNDLGVGLWTCDNSGNWFQIPHKGKLKNGYNKITFNLDKKLLSESNTATWTNLSKAKIDTYGLFFWSANVYKEDINVKEIKSYFLYRENTNKKTFTILDFSSPNYNKKTSQIDGKTGKRLEMSFIPSIMPKNPYDHDEFTIDLELTNEKNETIVVPAFYHQNTEIKNDGHFLNSSLKGKGKFQARYRPAEKGIYKQNIIIDWKKLGESKKIKLPDLNITGENQNIFIKVSKKNPNHFEIDGKSHWPIGINLRSVKDKRCQNNLRTKLTLDQGIYSYEKYFKRFSKAGINLVEIWMSAWNLGLEGRKDITGYSGTKFYNETNAKQLDELFKLAKKYKIRILLVINHHGQASTKCDNEWQHNPYNKINGGMLYRPEEVFHSSYAENAQDSIRRYIVARYADHPNLFAWKLWTEMDLTNIGYLTRSSRRDNHILKVWHEKSAKKWKKLDIYNHPIMTHWSTDYKLVDKSIASLPDINIIGIDAYYNRNRFNPSLANLMTDSMHNIHKGLIKFKKPILVTEFGGSPQAAPHKQLLADFYSGSWSALMTNHSGMPMIWWFEWVDQNNLWMPYTAIKNFIQNENLLENYKTKQLSSNKRSSDIFVITLIKKGRLLGYVLDKKWSNSGSTTESHKNTTIKISSKASKGNMILEWWNADNGTIAKKIKINHKGGLLTIEAPEFSRHISFKLYRVKDNK